MRNNRFKLILISITIFILIIAAVPKLANSLCTHTIYVGCWFEPCHTYDWQCENCWTCKVTCLYQAVYIVCHDEYGNEYMLSRCQTWICGYSPL